MQDYKSYLGLEFIEGNSGKKIPPICDKEKISDNIISAFMNMQSIKNDKFGKYSNPIFDTWSDCYRNFFDKIYTFSVEKHISGELEDIVMKALEIVN